MRRDPTFGRAPSRSLVTLLLLTALAGCGSKPPADDTVKISGALLPDETTPIGQKWRQLVNKGVAIGEATALVQTVPGAAAQYQTFVSGVIVYSNDFGAVYLTQAIFDRWQALTTTYDIDHNPVYASFGLPHTDYRHFNDGHDEAAFGGGIIIVSGGVARAIYGQINFKYGMVNRLVLGLPTSEEFTTFEFPDARVQTFQFGDIYWRRNVPGPFFVQSVFFPAIIAKGGLAVTGMPISDSSAVLDPTSTTGAAKGMASRFTNMAFYRNLATGEVFDVDGPLFAEYERQGGPTGWLGLPISSTAPTAVSSFPFNNFEHGVLVTYQTVPSVQVAAFGDLSFHLQRVTALGDDCSTCGRQDLFFLLDVSTSNGVIVNHQRMPDSGPFCQGCDSRDVNQDWSIGVANSALTVNGTVDVWDDDDSSGDDHLGTPTAAFNIDNLWGLLTSTVHKESDGEADFSIKSSHAFDAKDFRGTQYWSFHNYDVPTLTYDQFAASFEDVTPNESAFWNPFNSFYYDNFYKDVAAQGSCAGMNIEQLFASRGQSRIGMPIHDAYPDTQNGQRLDPNNPLHAALANEIGIKHGYQQGVDPIFWRVTEYLEGNTHNPGHVFNESKRYFDAGDPPTLSIYNDYWFGEAHSIKPYRWEATGQPCAHIGGTQCFRMFVADPNFPALASEMPNADGTRASDRAVEISESGDEYFYDGGSVTYHGYVWSGGRMMVEPGHLYDHAQVTPFYEPYLIGTAAFFFVVGSSGAVEQITDASGRTAFEPGLGGVPTRWDQARQDNSLRIPDLAPVPMTDGQAGLHEQLWVGKGAGATHVYEVTTRPGVSAGTTVEASFNAGAMSSRFLFPTTGGKSDRITAHQINTANRAISFGVPAGSVAKSITWTASGKEKQRWMEFGGLGMSPAQTIKMQSMNNGRRTLIDNDGPATTAHLRVKGGPNGAIVDLGTVAIPSGSSQVDLLGPKTTLTMTGAVSGNNGWLVAPVTVTLTTQDRGGFGIAVTEYSTDGVTWTAYAGPFLYATEGTTTIYFRAQDKEGNIEPTNSQVFKIDSQRPATTGSVDTTSGVKLTYGVTDPVPGSGVAGVHVVQGSTSATFLTSPSGTVALAGTCSAVELWGEDVAGNLSTPHLTFADTVPPVFTTLPPSAVSTTLCTVAAGLNLGSPVATDDCGGVTLTNNAPAKFPLGTTIVTWTATDGAGNVTTKTTTVFTELGDDVSCCPTGSNVIVGTPNNDTLNGTSNADCIIGRGGQDTIRGNGGNDAISGGEGNDDLRGGDGNDWVFGGTGQDTIRGENGNDTLSGGDGDDQVWGGANDDWLGGGQGRDYLYGEAGNDTLEGGVSDDVLDGGSGNDFLRGGADHDTLSGGGGSDMCVQDGGDVLNACTAVAP